MTTITVGLNMAALILFAGLDLSVHIVIVLLDDPSHILLCSALAVSFVAAVCISVLGVHHGGRMNGSIVLSPSVVNVNCCRIFSRFDQ
jgi:hypothetical protein